MRVGDLYAIVGTQLSDSAVDGLLVARVGAGCGNTGIELGDGGCVGAKAFPAVALGAGASIPATHTVVPGAIW